MDLSFSIVAKVVEQGWSKAKSLIGELSQSFDGFAGKSAIQWAKFGAGAISAFTAVIAGARAMRDGVLREIEKMQDADVSFTDDNNRWNRMEKKVSSNDEKEKLIEMVARTKRDAEKKREKLETREATQDPFEKANDLKERVINKALGLGNMTDTERDIKHLNQEIDAYATRLDRLKNLKVSSRFDKFEKSETDKQSAENRNVLLSRMKPEEKMQAANDAWQAGMKDLEATRSEFKANPHDEQVEEKIKNQTELVETLKEEWQKAGKEYEEYAAAVQQKAEEKAANEVEEKKKLKAQATTAAEQFAEKEKRRKDKEAKNPIPSPPPTSSTVEKPPAKPGNMRDSLTTAHTFGDKSDKFGRQSGNRFGRDADSELDEGGLMFGRKGVRHLGKRGFHMPAHLEKAIMNRQGHTQDPNKKDERLEEMKKQSKYLEEIAKKTGAAP